MFFQVNVEENNYQQIFVAYVRSFQYLLDNNIILLRLSTKNV